MPNFTSRANVNTPRTKNTVGSATSANTWKRSVPVDSCDVSPSAIDALDPLPRCSVERDADRWPPASESRERELLGRERRQKLRFVRHHPHIRCARRLTVRAFAHERSVVVARHVHHRSIAGGVGRLDLPVLLLGN